MSPWPRSSPLTPSVIRPRIIAQQIARGIALLARAMASLTSDQYRVDARRPKSHLLGSRTGCTIAVAPATPRLRSIRLLLGRALRQSARLAFAPRPHRTLKIPRPCFVLYPRPAWIAKAISIDLRDRVLAAVAGGMSRRQAADRFGGSAASAIRWCALERDVGDARPKRQGGGRRSGRIEAYAALTLGIIERTKDITIAEVQAKLAGRVFPSASARCGASSIVTGSRKKSAHAAEQERPMT